MKKKKPEIEGCSKSELIIKKIFQQLHLMPH